MPFTETTSTPEPWRFAFPDSDGAPTLVTSTTAPSAPSPTATKPTSSASTGRVYIEGKELHGVRLLPFGNGNADQAGSYQVWLWRRAGGVWVPDPVALVTETAFTLGAVTGISGQVLSDSLRLGTAEFGPHDCKQANLVEIQLDAGDVSNGVGVMYAPVRT